MLLAIFVLATGVQGLELFSGASWLSSMFNGVALIVAVALSLRKRRSRARGRGNRRQPPRGVGEAPETTGKVEGQEKISEGRTSSISAPGGA